MRAGGSGIAGFYIRTGVGTQVAEGGLPWRYDPTGVVVQKSPVKPVMAFDTAGGEREYVLEEAIVPDFGLVRAWTGDRPGNLLFKAPAPNFNPPAAATGPVKVAERQ